ncbi:twin-arginine translocase TatA/TatE family subunit [Geobacter sp. SVR]|uniref:twin-arginine translocase TatA/TatE family subunit n=1 Tax=Geobacter sp. SVR TaxID=2495594 RepID=UPI00143EF916|nr:twin-arginine translocase TatA/TatE family subunit [Geobacter sp. SVR]BCS53513.1 Sec-independent protein translocase protein TatA [Geobacter sp. SVR]GCF84290.1 Sec-independent protein translocase protein TatA [Geobacter sp. SVR]
MFGLGMPELFIILTLALLIFGPAKLPQLGASLGGAIRGFRRAVDEPVRLDSEQKREADS